MIPSSKTLHPGWPITSVQKRSVATQFNFCGHPSRVGNRYDNSDLFELLSFSPKVFLKLLSRCEILFHSAFLFQIKKHIFDAVCECYVMYDFAWMKCLCIRFTFMVFSFIKFANFSLMHTLRICWYNLFLLYLRIYFCLDSCPLHHISFFVLGNKKHSYSSLYVRNTGLFRFYTINFTILVLSINFAWIIKNAMQLI